MLYFIVYSNCELVYFKKSAKNFTKSIHFHLDKKTCYPEESFIEVNFAVWNNEKKINITILLNINKNIINTYRMLSKKQSSWRSRT